MTWPTVQGDAASVCVEEGAPEGEPELGARASGQEKVLTCGHAGMEGELGLYGGGVGRSSQTEISIKLNSGGRRRGKTTVYMPGSSCAQDTLPRLFSCPVLSFQDTSPGTE